MSKLIISPNNGDLGGVTKGKVNKITGLSKPVDSPNPTQGTQKGGGIGSKPAPIKSPIPKGK